MSTRNYSKLCSVGDKDGKYTGSSTAVRLKFTTLLQRQPPRIINPRASTKLDEKPDLGFMGYYGNGRYCTMPSLDFGKPLTFIFALVQKRYLRCGLMRSLVSQTRLCSSGRYLTSWWKMTPQKQAIF